MANVDYNRYEIFRNEDDTRDQLPFVAIPQRNSDKFMTWNLGRDRLDKLASKYYGNVFLDFLILYANPQYIDQYDIEDGDVIRIPFPKDAAIKSYEERLTRIRNR